MAPRNVITLEEGAELKRLYEDLEVANRTAVAALATHGKPLEGAALQRLVEADAKVTVIVRRIKEILGVTGPWNS